MSLPYCIVPPAGKCNDFGLYVLFQVLTVIITLRKRNGEEEW